MTATGRVRAVVASVALAAVAPALAAQVRVLTALDATTRDAVAAALADDAVRVEFDVIGLDEWAEVARGERAIAPDVQLVFGVDADLLGLLADRAVVDVPRPSVVPAGVEPFATASERILVPFAMPWVIAYAEREYSAGTVPVRVEHWLDPRLEDRIVLTSPAVVPGPWLTWTDAFLAAGRSVEWCFAWTTSLDARVRAYAIASSEAISALGAATASLALVPLGVAERAPAGIGVAQPADLVPLSGLGLAVLRDHVVRDDVRDVFARLLSADVARALASVGVLPCPRADLAVDDLPPRLRDAERLARTERVAFRTSADLLVWLERWEERVRGRGRELERLDHILDLVFGVLFLAGLFFVWSRSRKKETTV